MMGNGGISMMQRIGRSIGLIVLAMVAIAAVPGVGSAAFSAAVNLSVSGQNADSPQVAVGPDGATTITWSRPNGAGNYIIQARTRPAGSADFGTPVNLSADSRDASEPQVAVGPDGATTITWRRYNDAGNSIVQAVTRPAGSATFSATVDLSVSGQDAHSPQVAVGPDGATTITWFRYNGDDYIVQAVTRPTGSAIFSATVDLSVSGQDADSPQVAVGPDGATTITWRRFNDAGNWIIQARTRPAGSVAFLDAVNLSASGQNAFDPQVAVGPGGATTITWSRPNGAGSSIIQAVTRPAGLAIFLDAVNLSESSRDAFLPQVAVGPDGATTITWHRYDGTTEIIQAATRPAGSAAFSVAVNLSLSALGRSASLPQVAVGPDGATTITWRRSDGTNTIIQASSGEPTHLRLSVTTDGSGAGSVTSVPAGINCGATCAAYFAIGSTVTLTATAASGSVYTGWSGGCTGTSSTCVVTLNAATSVTATFGVASVAPAESEVAAFKVLSVKAGRTALRSRVTLPGPGVLSQRARSTGSNRVRVCAARKKVSRASTVLLLCPLTRAAKRALLHRSLHVRVITTFTPTGGVAQVRTKIIRLGVRGRVGLLR